MRARRTTVNRHALWFVGACLVTSALIWALWVVPVSTSVSDARPLSLGEAAELPEAGASGVWATGSAALLGLVECRAATVDGRALAVRGVPSPSWDDTLWWMTPRESYAPLFSVDSANGAAATVVCTSRLDTYDGAFLVTSDVSGGGTAIGLGGGGNADYAAGSVLALGAVALALFSVSVTMVLILQRLGLRRVRNPSIR